METRLPQHNIVLLGVGHTNAHIVRMWRMRPIADAQLICVSDFPIVTYSGMLPGVLSGQYPVERMQIDLVRLCAAANARLVLDNVVGLDVNLRQLLFEKRPALPFDVLSIGIGSVPSREGVIPSDDTLMAIKPMQTFLDRLNMRLEQWQQQQTRQRLRIAIVGGGAGSVEIAFCLPRRLASILPDVPTDITLMSADPHILRGSTPQTRRRAEILLAQRGVTVRCGCRVSSVSKRRITTDKHESLEVDLALWATHAAAPDLLSHLGLPLDERGFLETSNTLRTTAEAPVFAVGDTGTIEGDATPKAGVYAVRQGPVLWDNIRRTLSGLPLRPYEPQRRFLKLLNTADNCAIVEYSGLTFYGSWCWKLKDFIDSRFMEKYQDYTAMDMSTHHTRDKPPRVMRCAGCGGKISGSVLSRVLSRLDIPKNDHVVLGLEAPDDAAIVTAPHGNPLTVTVDFFAAPLDDPYTVGRIAALNSASDVFALGGRPLAALAAATIPVGNPPAQEQILYELLAGAVEEFREMGATLVGGHTIEGPRLTIGFTVLADQGRETPRAKGQLRIGDRLVLTKPLGTGVLLAAHMQARCRADWMQTLLTTMLHSNQHASQLIEANQIAGLTDVTGFGLGGHLLEMLRAADAAAHVSLDEVTLLPGTDQLLRAGVESTLTPANRATEADIQVSETDRQSSKYAALFDPQTCGGLLMGVPEQHVDRTLEALAQQSEIPATVIGTIETYHGGGPRIRIVK